MASAAKPDYNYYPGRSTSHIFYHDNNGNQRILTLRPSPTTPPPVPVFPTVEGALSVCASSRGFTICCDKARSNLYYFVNPFAAGATEEQPHSIGPLGAEHTRPRYPDPPGDVDLVLVLYMQPEPPSGRLRSRRFHIIRAVPEGDEPGLYTFQAYYSATDRWVSHRGISLMKGREIVPNSGVSCSQFAYWLTRNPSSVLKVDITASNDKMISFLDLPPDPPADARMQLGRVGDDMLGLVIVNKARSTVELYTRGLGDRRWGMPDIFIVVIDRAAAAAVWSWEREDGALVLVCKEMPWPIRFESFKMEALLWVAGDVVVLERNAKLKSLYFLNVVAREQPPSIIDDGLPHVSHHLIPTKYTWGFVEVS